MGVQGRLDSSDLRLLLSKVRLAEKAGRSGRVAPVPLSHKHDALTWTAVDGGLCLSAASLCVARRRLEAGAG